MGRSARSKPTPPEPPPRELAPREDWHPARGHLRVLPRVVETAAGRVRVEPVSPLRHYSRPQRLALLIDFLEACALIGGDKSAALDAARLHQWMIERKSGKVGTAPPPDQRPGALTLVDDLGTLPAGSRVDVATRITVGGPQHLALSPGADVAADADAPKLPGAG